MPACVDCKYLDNESCLGYQAAAKELKRELPQEPVGGCLLPIVDNYLEQIKPGMQVLEIGCGSWRKIIDHCEKVGAHFEGIDVQEEYYGIACVATRYENLAELSFEDKRFDIVIGNQTMEHWGEHGCTTSWGLYQCFRVLKPGGKLLLNVPMHFHGTKEFILGDLKGIEKLFTPFTNSLKMERWGFPASPLREHIEHPNYSAINTKPVHMLDIEALKDKELPTGISNRLGFTGKLAKLFHYPMSYNWYLLLKKLGHKS